MLGIILKNRVNFYSVRVGWMGVGGSVFVRDLRVSAYDLGLSEEKPDEGEIRTLGVVICREKLIRVAK